jgi:hypothetical protein
MTPRLTQAPPPTGTRKIGRCHQTMSRELRDVPGMFADLPVAQAAIVAWPQSYNDLSDLLWAGH